MKNTTLVLILLSLLNYPLYAQTPLKSSQFILIEQNIRTASSEDPVGYSQTDLLPSFVMGDIQEVLEDCGDVLIDHWARDINMGPLGQYIRFNTQTDSPDLFFKLPQISPDGTLSYTPAPDAFGTAMVKVVLYNGGIENHTSLEKMFTICIKPVNDPPSFYMKPQFDCIENFNMLPDNSFVSKIRPGPENERNQLCTFLVTTDNPGLFSRQPSISSQGQLDFELKQNQNGSAWIMVQVKDDGGTENGGINISSAIWSRMNVLARNDCPYFQLPAFTHYASDENVQIIESWATDISPGENETEQDVAFELEIDHPELFTILPVVSPQGVLSYQFIQGALLSSTIKIYLLDDSFMSGCFRYPEQDFEFTLFPVNYVQQPEKYVLSLKTGWNLISVPVDLSIESTRILSQETSGIFAYDKKNGYFAANDMKCFKGYWIKSAKNCQVELKGQSCIDQTQHLEQGWNLIGSPNYPARIQINPENPNNIMFEYAEHTYKEVNMTCQSGKGYWLKMTESGQIDFEQFPKKGSYHDN